MSGINKVVMVLASIFITTMAQVSFVEAQMQDFIDERIDQKEQAVSDVDAVDTGDTGEGVTPEELREEFADDKALYEQRQQMRRMQKMNMMNRGRE